MKEILLVFIFLIICSSINAQKGIFGKYKFYSEDNEPGSLTLNCNKTFLMEDTMFVNNDSSIIAIIKGNWKIQKSKMLVLLIDSVFSQEKAFGNLKKVKYFIRDGRFYLKIQNERQYNRQNKKLYKEFPNSIPTIWEDYKIYKSKQDNRCFFKIDSFDCPDE